MLEIQKHATELGMRLWRNNVGKLPDGKGGWVSYGIQNPGGSDLIGFKRVTITPDMVGQQIPIFTAIEVKSEKGKATDAQITFINFIVASGGFAGIARSREDLDGLVSMPKH